MDKTDPGALLQLIENNPTASPTEIEDAWNKIIKADEIFEAVVSSPLEALGARSMEDILRIIRRNEIDKKIYPPPNTSGAT
jgi:hypothetical protein